jgi:hypothetical protein
LKHVITLFNIDTVSESVTSLSRGIEIEISISDKNSLNTISKGFKSHPPIEPKNPIKAS